MSETARIIKEVAASLEREPSVNLHRFPVAVTFEDGVLTLDGEVEQITAKKCALEAAAAVHVVTGIADRLRLVPAVQMQDGEIRDHVCNALLVRVSRRPGHEPAAGRGITPGFTGTGVAFRPR